MNRLGLQSKKCQINANELEPWISFILNRFGTAKCHRLNNPNKLKLKPDCIKFLHLKFVTSSYNVMNSQ